MAKKKKGDELLFVAECKAPSGESRSVSVYKKGRAYMMRGPGLNLTPCHPSVHTEADIKKEIALVYKVEVVGIKYPHELGRA